MSRQQVILLLLCGLVGFSVSWRETFDQQMYEDVLDEELCNKQLDLLDDHPLRRQFFDASGKFPSGIATGNLNDFGDYHLCLSINGPVQDTQVQGKYCAILVPLQLKPIDWPSVSDLNITWPKIQGLNETRSNITLSDINPETVIKTVNKEAQIFADYDKANQSSLDGRLFPGLILSHQGLTLGVCLPKACTARQALMHWKQVVPFLNIQFQDFYCRLPADKPFVVGDYVAIIIFSFILLLTAISTTYDLTQKFYFKRDASESSDLCRSFSVYTNGRRLLTFSSTPGALDSVDGIRSISMMWVIAGHTYFFLIFGYIHNQKDILEWTVTFSSLWINAAPITVDTFFFLTGLLIVYTTIDKVCKENFLPSLHLFYLHRLLRVFPLLAVMVLLSASLMHHLADGPFWVNVAASTQNCREYWWSALLHVQNYVNPPEICLAQSWYLSVDTQLYLLSPLILWWLWGQPRRAWCVLSAFLLLSLVSSTIISYLYNFSATFNNISRLDEVNEYHRIYYVNTFARAPPFFVGMIYGYMLILYKDKKIRISKTNASLLWGLSLLIMAFCVVSIYPVLQADHTAQWFDNFLNSYMRAMWAAALGWLIFACAKGYGGPVAWFLSLTMWKLPARLSYAMYLVHVPIMLITNGTWVKTHYFSTGETLYMFMSHLGFTFVAAFLLCLLVDAPFSTLQKQMFEGILKKPDVSERTESTVNIVEDGKMYKTSL